MRAIDGDRLLRELTALSHGQVWPGWTYEGIRLLIERQPTLTPPNESLTWEELKAETKINPVYSMKYGWIFPSTVKDEPYKQVWFFTSKGFANTELFYRDTFYRRPPEGEEDT